MPVRLDVAQLKSLLTATPADQNVMLVGRHGIGKSEIIREHYESQGMPVVGFFLGQMSDPGDLIGLMHKDAESDRSEFLPPYWWPAEDTPIVLFLDELNRARPEILQSVMELTLSKTLAGKRLPEGSVIVSAVNDGDEYDLTDLDPALVSRFNLYGFAPTLADWVAWARENNLDERVIGFLELHPHLLDGDEAEGSTGESWSTLQKSPDRRAWARVSTLISAVKQIGEQEILWIAGVVGSSAANAFRRWLAVQLPVSAAELLSDFETHRGKIESLTLDQLTALNDQIFVHLSHHLPIQNLSLENLHRYLANLQGRELRESIAHFVSLSERTQYEAVAQQISQSPDIAIFLADYLDGISLS